jgi:hypothetical protein
MAPSMQDQACYRDVVYRSVLQDVLIVDLWRARSIVVGFTQKIGVRNSSLDLR